MIVLDTNVLGELMRPSASSTVTDWMDRQRAVDLHVTTITVAEVLLGIELLPHGRRHEGIAAHAGALFDEEFAGRILLFDADSALHYAGLVAARRRAGRPISQADAQIAATCVSGGAGIATRNAGGFADLPLDVVNPWGQRRSTGTSDPRIRNPSIAVSWKTASTTGTTDGNPSLEVPLRRRHRFRLRHHAIGWQPHRLLLHRLPGVRRLAGPGRRCARRVRRYRDLPDAVIQSGDRSGAGAAAIDAVEREGPDPLVCRLLQHADRHTPIGNTVNARLPFVELIHTFIDSDDRDAVLGPVRSAMQVRHARGAPDYPKPSAGFPVGVTARIAMKLLIWKLQGRGTPNAFFRDDGRPVVEPVIARGDGGAQSS